MLRLTTRTTPVGRLTLGSGPAPGVGVETGGGRALVLCEFGHRADRAVRELARLAGASGLERVEASACPVLTHAASELEAFFAGQLRAFTVPVWTPGTAFQERVWAELARIPFGETLSYGELARRVGVPGGARAVGAANGANRVAIIVPCHRVIDASGGLHGYGGGLEMKQRLLQLEGAVCVAPLFAGGAV